MTNDKKYQDLKEIPPQRLFELLNSSSDKKFIKEIKKEIHRRKTLGQKISFPAIEKPKVEKEKKLLDSNIKSILSDSPAGFPGWLIGCTFENFKSLPLFSIVAIYSPMPFEQTICIADEQFSINKIRKFFRSHNLGTGTSIEVDWRFGLKKIIKSIELVEEKNLSWKGKKNHAIDAIKSYRSDVDKNIPHPAEQLVKVPTAVKEKLRADSGHLHQLPIFDKWVPEPQTVEKTVNAMNELLAGIIITSEENKKVASVEILHKAIDGYFTGKKLKAISEILLDIALILHQTKKSHLSQQLKALSEIILEGRIEPHRIGFLASCFNKIISAEKQKATVSQQIIQITGQQPTDEKHLEGRIPLDDVRAKKSNEHRGLIIPTISLIKKPGEI